MINITVFSEHESHKEPKLLKAIQGESLLEVLRKNGYQIPASCNGKGTCGKCKVNIRKEDERTFQEVLSCHTEVSDGMTVLIPAYVESLKDRSDNTSHAIYSSVANHGVAVDLGTTTVATSLVSLQEEKVLSTCSDWNVQIPYGSDVISRIHYCMEQKDGLETLSDRIGTQIDTMIVELFQMAGLPLEPVRLMVSGNTIMQHIFAGISPVSMAQAPYEPVTLFNKDLFDSSLELTSLSSDSFREQTGIHYMPCISSFVGGDITSGLYATGLSENEGNWLFLDIGTNGEMAIGGKDGFLTCSVATGPAFEGAQIECGCINRPGAVTHVTWNPFFHQFTLQIEAEKDGKIPAVNGICGSGLLDLISVLLELGFIENTGRIRNEEEIEEIVDEEVLGALEESLGYDFLETDQDGNGIFYLSGKHDVYLCTKDIRNIQLAKASVRAGVELLLQKKGLTPPSIDGVIIAGGFGKHLDLESVAKIGMLPEDLLSKVSFAGNASLEGAKRALTEKNAKEELLCIQSMCQYIELADTKEFSELFLSYMNLS